MMKETRLFEVKVDFPKGPHYEMDEDGKPIIISDKKYSDKQLMRYAKTNLEGVFPEIKIVSQKISSVSVGHTNGVDIMGSSMKLLMAVPGYYKLKRCMEKKMDEFFGMPGSPMYPGGSGAICRMEIKRRSSNYTL